MVASAPTPVPGSAGHAPSGDRLARWAVRLSAVGGAAIGASIAMVAISYGVGAESAVEDGWVGVLAAVLLGPGLLGAFIGFVLAVVAKARHEHRALLWLPLAVLPAVLLFLVLGEAFWWE